MAAETCTRGGEADRGRVVVVGRDGDQRGLGHRGDLPQLLDAAAVAHVRIHDVGRAQLEAARGTRRVCRAPRRSRSGSRSAAGTRRAPSRLRGGHRLLVPERPEALQLAGHADRVHRGEAPVHLDQQIDRRARPPRAPRRTVATAFSSTSRDDVRAPRPGERVELERGEPAGHRLRAPAPRSPPASSRRRTSRWRRPAPARGTARPAASCTGAPWRLPAMSHSACSSPLTADQKSIAPRLAAEVVIGPVHEVGDVGGVAADQVAADRLHERDDAGVAIGLGVALAPAVRAAVGLDLHEAEVLAAAQVGEERRHAAHVALRDRTRIGPRGAGVVRFPRPTRSCTL